MHLCAWRAVQLTVYQSVHYGTWHTAGPPSAAETVLYMLNQTVLHQTPHSILELSRMLMFYISVYWYYMLKQNRQMLNKLLHENTHSTLYV